MIKIYKTKPELIKAVLWNGKYSSSIDIQRSFKFKTNAQSYNEKTDTCYYWEIETSEGDQSVYTNEYIIKDSYGKIFICSPERFEKVYTLLEDLE